MNQCIPKPVPKRNQHILQFYILLYQITNQFQSVRRQKLRSSKRLVSHSDAIHHVNRHLCLTYVLCQDLIRRNKTFYSENITFGLCKNG